jgi:hypothetical protein
LKAVPSVANKNRDFSLFGFAKLVGSMFGQGFNEYDEKRMRQPSREFNLAELG